MLVHYFTYITMIDKGEPELDKSLEKSIELMQSDIIDSDDIFNHHQMVAEYLQLKYRCKSIRKTIIKAKAGKHSSPLLSTDNNDKTLLNLLVKQARYMEEYLLILETRMEIENIDISAYEK